MTPEEYFFNMYLGRELGVCGDLIYKGFESLENDSPIIKTGEEEKLTYLNEAPAFSFLINTSVAFERLGKIIILFLLRKNKPDEIEAFLSDIKDDKTVFTSSEKGLNEKAKKILKSHKSIAIVNYIHRLDSGRLDLTTNDRSLLQSFDEFYGKFRYGRFHPKNIDGYNQDSVIVNKLLNDFLGKNLKPKSCCDSEKERALYSLGICINELSHKYYNAVKELATEMNVYTYELRNYSYAQLVFWNQEHSLHELFIRQRIAREELFYFLTYNQIKTKINKKIPKAEIPLPLDINFDGVEVFLKFGNDISLVDSVSDALDWWAGLDDDSEKQQKIEEREHEVQELIKLFSKE